MKTRQLLKWCGIDEIEIQRWSLESLQQKDFLDFSKPHVQLKVNFDTRKLPEGEILDKNNPKHKVFVDYVQKRGISIDDYPFLITPDQPDRMGNRVIVPYTYKNKIVGHTSRFLDDRIPKYLNEQQSGYVFNIDIQKSNWSVCIVTEGHDDISNEQARMLSNLNRTIIVVPDQDETGLKICDRAFELGYQVSLPNWGKGIKDTNDAVIKYGKLPTLVSILQSATNSKIKTELRKKQIGKQIGI
jgi:DNA primase